ncbi:YtxH domain-containing protein [Thermohalobacter berrensis]|uniref:YtxH domain-containing protein n=1 Tax=Thermohalobacter berrensis TaxID=99594 RepID=UPI000E70D925|nr:YtxH domain-containing protein [Thermohalobacter berrensis]
MNGKFVQGIVTGSLIGATASMYAMSKMSPRQRRKMMKKGRKLLINMMSNMGV